MLVSVSLTFGLGALNQFYEACLKKLNLSFARPRVSKHDAHCVFAPQITTQSTVGMAFVT
ncbi:hypothetical protein VR7878_01364 [Vibrio ruber DSM 16370]|uniref:Uncharacterized protein n=1 Tax=Vibrio ruber (strain DSM 16370 / JCM 11486 / BCRC 17186 / CECT 7878 / LMG 23124 / VR1) TaxID=1123498 RepID=A0A1R4LGH2_VIBR1|nr:hypothetical protein VR7878_01364 [Vibrio ruber DSM 16370]